MPRHNPTNLIRQRQLAVERELVVQALATAGTVAGAARVLGCARETVYDIAARHGLKVPGHATPRSLTSAEAPHANS